MATIKLGTTGSANRLISYAEKKAVEHEGVDCNPEYAKSQFATTRELYGKTDGIQAHHVIQSFKPGEITPDQANKVGLDLARKLGKGHECAVYTHADKDHIHNHIVINSVNHENGKKLHLHGQQAIDKVRGLSDELCKERGLSVVKEPTSKVRYTLAEQGILERGETSWKDELRQAIDYEKAHSKNYEQFKSNLTEKYGIEVNDKKKHITYKHPDRAKVVRGNKLGLDYERGTIEHGFSRQIESSKERRNTDLSSTKGAELERAIDWGAVEHNLGSKENGLSEQPSNEITRGIQQEIRDIKDRTSRATESTEERNKRIEADSRKHEPSEPVIEPKHRNRGWEMER